MERDTDTDAKTNTSSFCYGLNQNLGVSANIQQACGKALSITQTQQSLIHCANLVPETAVPLCELDASQTSTHSHSFFLSVSESHIRR